MTNLQNRADGRSTAPTVSATPDTGRSTTLARLLHGGRLDALLVGVLAAAISGAFLWVPSVWYDEAATVISATRSWGQLWQMVQTVDLVHATYYAFMHLWFDVFPYSPVALRVPSTIVTGLAAALTVVLARSLADRRTAVVAGLLFCLIPRVTWMGGEGRSYAFSAMFAVALTLVLVTAARRTAEVGETRTRASAVRWWVGYAVLAVVSVLFFLYVAFVVVGHGVTLLLQWRRERRRRADAGLPGTASGGSAAHPPVGDRGPHGARGAFVGWFCGAAVAGLASLPVVYFTSEQSGQVGWLDRPGFATINQVLTTQWFYQNDRFAVFGWLLVVASLVVVGAGLVPRARGLVAVVLPWMVVPIVGLVGVSLVTEPLFSPRYLTFGTPAVAIMMAVAVAAIPWRRVVALVLLIALVLTAPTWERQRQPEAKDSAAWNQVADLVTEQRALEPAGTTEGVVFGPVRRHPKATSRIIENTYPAAFEGMSDFTLETPAAETGGLWETQHPLEDVIDRTDDLDVVWLITSDKQDWRPRVTADLAAKGFHVADEWHLTRTNVLKYER
ncbi:mannosyltransferase [Frigoribacterium sp. PvP054]|uniref:glycosyltransferase family 39 protein n=1 Tax=Frigoribacterium sp. PvP054 TaxID=3156438 RepID=UPI003392A974